MASRFWVGGTGNWSDTAHWSDTSGGGAGADVPVAADAVTIDANSGSGTVTITVDIAAACTSISLSRSSTILLLNAGVTLSGALSVPSSVSSVTLNLNGQTCQFGSVGWNANGSILQGTGAAVTITGTGTPWSNTSNTITWTGTGTFTFNGGGNITFSYTNTSSRNYAGVSLVFANSGTVAFAGSGQLTCADLTRTGWASKADSITPSANVILTGTCTLGGNTTQGINRLLVQSNTVGTQRTITAAAYVITGDVDFRDINLAYSGGASWTNTGSAFIGDALGNAGAVTTNATVSATQTATGTASFTWSTHGWTSRVPLPQDDVVINNAFVAGRTVTADMPRLGRSIDFTGATGTPDWAIGASCFIFGSLALVSAMTISGTSALTLAGRGSHSLTSSTRTFSQSLIFGGPGSVYTLADSLSLLATRTLQHDWGTLDASTVTINVTAGKYASGGTNTRTVNLGSGVWSMIQTGTFALWNATAGLTVVPGTATISFDATDSGVTKTFAGGGLTYGTLRHTATGSAALTITGNNTFATLDLECTTARTITFPAGGTQTITGTLTLLGAAGQLLSLRSSATPTKWYIAAGATSAQYCDVKDCTATGPGTPIDDSTGGVDSGNNIGWLFTCGGSAGYSSTLLTLGVG